MFKLTQILLVALAAFTTAANAVPSRGAIPDIDVPLSQSPKAHTVATPPSHAGNSKKLSNADRLARGLAPNAPKLGRFFPGDVTRTYQARQANPSAVVRNGFIAVNRQSDGTPVGFVSSQFFSGTLRRYGITGDATTAQQVQFTSGSNPLPLLKTTNDQDAAHPYLGGVVGPRSSDDNLSAGSDNYVFLTGVNLTPQGSSAAPVGNSYSDQDSESNIWNYDDASLAITASWVNTNGLDATPTVIYYYPSANALLLIGDATAFFNTYQDGYPVTFTFVPNP